MNAHQSAKGFQDPGFKLDLRILRFRSRPVEDPALLALELVSAGRAHDAIEVVDTALGRDPDDVDVLLGCGLAAMRAGKLSFAQWVLTRAALAAPGWSEPLRSLSEVLAMRGREQASLAVARRALAAGDRDPRLSARVQEADRAGALDARLASFRADPGRHEPALLAGEFAAAGRTSDALAVLETALSREDDADLRWVEARVRDARGDHAGAEAALCRAVALAPDWEEPVLALAAKLRDRGAHREALAVVSRALASRVESQALDALRGELEKALPPTPAQAAVAVDRLLGDLDRVDPIGEETRRDLAHNDTLVDEPAIRKRKGWLPRITPRARPIGAPAGAAPRLVGRA